MFERLRRGGLKRRSSVEALVHDGAEGPEVGLGVVLQAHDDLGGHVHRGTAERGRHVAVLQKAGESEVG